MLAQLVLAAVLAACASVPEEQRYRDPEIEPEKVAVLSTLSYDYPNWVTIEFVDGKNILRPWRWGQRVKVLPGKHKIRAVYVEHRYFSDEYFWVSIPVTVEAGHMYEIRGRKAKNKVRIWLEDVENQVVIGVGTVFYASGK